MKKINSTLLLIILFFLIPFVSEANSGISAGDTAWMLMATAMVMLMTPAGLALFYGGLSPNKSMLNTVGMSYVAYCIAFVVWIIAGYSLSFGDANSVIGGMHYALLKHIGINDLEGSIPKLLFVAFQGTFAAIAVAIVSGSIIQRIKFSTWIVFSALWVLFVYSPLAHWVWGGGFLSHNGELDFAGGTVIHINSGIAGLVVAYLIGKRKDHGKESEAPTSIKLTVLGSALLWFGWFGFNAGSALEASGIAANALLVTNVAACTGGLAWLSFEWYTKKRPSLLGVASGAVSGLVAITPAAGYVDASAALFIGFFGGIVGYIGVEKLKGFLGYDDTLDAFGIHGLVGIFGAIITGVFANPDINGAAGLFYGNPKQVVVQAFAVLITIVFSAVATALVFWVSQLVTKGGRVNESLEKRGLDQGFHGEKGFNLP